MSDVIGLARFTFHDGKVEDFKRLSEQCMEIVRTKDTGTLEYSIYLNDDETEAVVVERYRDSDALAEHLENVGELMQPITECGTVVGETLGDVSDEFRAKMAGNDAVRLLTPWRTM